MNASGALAPINSRYFISNKVQEREIGSNGNVASIWYTTGIQYRDPYLPDLGSDDCPVLDEISLDANKPVLKVKYGISGTENLDNGVFGKNSLAQLVAKAREYSPSFNPTIAGGSSRRSDTDGNFTYVYMESEVTIDLAGQDSVSSLWYLSNITVSGNAINGTRYGVRAGFFLGAGPVSAGNANERTGNLVIENNAPGIVAGRAGQAQAGIQDQRKGLAGVFNPTGDREAVRYVGGLTISGNSMTGSYGGGGIEMVGIDQVASSAYPAALTVSSNVISNVLGNYPGDPVSFPWSDGDGIRLWGLSVGTFSIVNNQISNVDGYGIFVTDVDGGVGDVSSSSNAISGYAPWASGNSGPIYIRSSTGVSTQ
ncbi:MAG: hypothetical protein P4M08_09820 [Oligoflexia bacterium]|nr:hypothetical protein [Oligoflexia bacterium]